MTSPLAWTILDSYINGLISNLSSSFAGYCLTSVTRSVIGPVLPCILPNPYLADLSTAPGPGHKDRTTR